jgi:hypothetical protein
VSVQKREKGIDGGVDTGPSGAILRTDVNVSTTLVEDIPHLTNLCEP